MKLAYILNTYPQPSHSFIRRELRALERQGFDISRIAMRRSDQDLVDPQDREEAAQTQYVLDAGPLGLIKATLRRFWAKPSAFLRAARTAWEMGVAAQSGVVRHMVYLAEACWVAEYCQIHKVTHCHAHFGTNATAVARIARYLGGPKYSFTVHGPEEFDAAMALSLGEKLNDAAFAVAISQFGRSQLCRWADFATWSRLHVVHCGIEPDHFSDPTEVPEGPLRLVSIGRFVEQKGQMTLLQALVELAARGGPKVHLDLVGDGEMRPEFEQYIRENGLSECVQMTGWLDEQSLNAVLEQAQILVMPSFAEGLPMVIMEAMASARPVLATQIAGIPELVREEETGWLVPAGDATALTDALVKVSAIPNTQLQQMGQRGRARVLERHDVRIEGAKLAEIFRKYVQS
ncbi:MAG: glycosyltransferase [Paracoccaceae bacterium]